MAGRRRSDYPTGRRRSDRPLALEREMERARDSSLARLREEGIMKLPPPSLGIVEIRSRNVGLAIQEFVKEKLMRSSVIGPQMIRLMAGESAVTFPNAMKTFQGYLASPRETVVHLKEGHQRFKGYLRIVNKGPGAAPAMLSDVPPLVLQDADPLMRMAVDLDRVCYVSGRDIYWVQRKDPHGNVSKGTIGERHEEPIMLIPFSDELGLITVRGRTLNFGDWINRVENAVLLASDISHLASSNLGSRMDPLTGAFNKRAFHKLVEYAIEQFFEKGTPTSVVMCDIDHFKRVNDTFGHHTGDKVLSSFAVTASTTLRSLDRLGILRNGDTPMEQELGRLGGEEFAIVLDQTNLQGAIVAAERCRKAVEQSVVIDAGYEIGVTISIGIASVPEIMFSNAFGREGDGDLQTVERIRARLLRAADDALYVAKEDGRNRVVVGHLDRKMEWGTSHVTINDDGTVNYRKVYKKKTDL